jgi:integrase/recombinase XerD
MPKKGTHTPRDPLGDPNDPHGWHVLVEAFCEWMGVQNYSPRTIHGRRTYLKYFVLWAIERGLTRPDEVTKPILERYQRHLYHHRKTSGEPMSVRGQHARLIPVRAFFKWAARANHLLYNPASEIDLPKLDHRLPKHLLSISEVEKIMSPLRRRPPARPQRPRHQRQSHFRNPLQHRHETQRTHEPPPP